MDVTSLSTPNLIRLIKNAQKELFIRITRYETTMCLLEESSLSYDYDHEDKFGNPISPPKRTPEEEVALKAQLDRELDEYMAEGSRIERELSDIENEKV